VYVFIEYKYISVQYMILAPQLLQYIIVQYASRPLGSQYITVQTVKSGSGVGGRVGGNVRGQGSGVSGGSYCPGRRLGCFMMG